MLCIWITLLCCSLVAGERQFDWENAINEVLVKWRAAETSQDISGMMMDTFSDNVTFYIPQLPPVGKQAMNDELKLQLESHQWPNKMNVFLQNIFAECGTVAAAEVGADEVMRNGNRYKGSGIWVAIRQDDAVKFVAVTWSSEVPLNDTNTLDALC